MQSVVYLLTELSRIKLYMAPPVDVGTIFILYPRPQLTSWMRADTLRGSRYILMQIGQLSAFTAALGHLSQLLVSFLPHTP